MTKPYPEFSSETQEADWLFAHREDLDDYFSPATMRLDEALAEHGLVMPEALIAVPLSREDRIHADEQARAAGVAPEEYIGRVVHEALKGLKAA